MSKLKIDKRCSGCKERKAYCGFFNFPGSMVPEERLNCPGYRPKLSVVNDETIEENK